MEKIKKNILIVLIIILTFVVFFIYIFFYDTKVFDQNIDKEFLAEQAVVIEDVGIPIFGPTKNKSPDGAIIQKERKVNLIVFDKNYEIEINEEFSVFEAMDNLQKNIDNFSFKYKEYPSLGIFVNEINYIKDGGGKYWIYYVNDKEVSVGISKYILKEGDIIKWELK